MAVGAPREEHLWSLRTADRPGARKNAGQWSTSGRMGRYPVRRILVHPLSGQRPVWAHRSFAADEVGRRLAGNWRHERPRRRRTGFLIQETECEQGVARDGPA